MTPNNPEQSDCCKAPITSGGDARTGFYVCTECQRACDVYVPYESVRRLPEQTEPEPTESWEEGFDEKFPGLSKISIGVMRATSDGGLSNIERKECGFQVKAFIRKVEDQAYERGFRECEAQGENESFKLTEKQVEELRKEEYERVGNIWLDWLQSRPWYHNATSADLELLDIKLHS